MSYPVEASKRRVAPLAMAAAGSCALAAGLVVGDKAALAGAVAFLVACAAALRDTTSPLLTWRAGIVALILVVWLIPIRNYRLPVELPFGLEVYRLIIIALTLTWLASAIARGETLRAGGHGRAAFFLGATTIAALVVNIGTIRDAGLQTDALKSISVSLSFLLAFVLVCSTIESMADVDSVIMAIVLGGSIVAVAAIYEGRSYHNYFNDLGDWIPLLDYQGREAEDLRAYRLRVRASAQHPIALGAALAMCVPLALYLARRAATRARCWLWILVGFVLLTGSLSSLSRTVVVMLVAMTALALWIRPREVLRLWPVLVAVPLLVPLVAPGTLRTLYAALRPSDGLVAEQQTRAGEQGSGRIADLEPGLRLWLESPVLGPGPGTAFARDGTEPLDPALRRQDEDPANPATKSGIIFDNQYMFSLVTVGLVGLAAVVWFVWGTVMKLTRAARQRLDEPGDVLAACAVSSLGFAVGMLTYDTFAFIQVTLIFFVIAALGLTARSFPRG